MYHIIWSISYVHIGWVEIIQIELLNLEGIIKIIFKLNEEADFDEAHSLQPFLKRGGFDYQLPQG